MKSGSRGDLLSLRGIGLLSNDAAAAGLRASGRQYEIVYDSGGTHTARMEGNNLANYWRADAMKDRWHIVVRISADA
jgi:hypothetical protein